MSALGFEFLDFDLHCHPLMHSYRSKKINKLKILSVTTSLLLLSGCLDKAELEKMSKYAVSVPVYSGCESSIESMKAAGINVTFHHFSVTSGVNNPVTGYVELYSEKMREIDVRNAALTALASCTPNASASIALGTDNGWSAVGHSIAIKMQLEQKVFSIVVENDHAVIYYLDRDELRNSSSAPHMPD